MKFLILIVFFLLFIGTVEATEHGAYNLMAFQTEISAPLPTGAADVGICHEIMEIGDDTICITNDGEVILVVTATIGLVAIPVMKRRGNKE